MDTQAGHAPMLDDDALRALLQRLLPSLHHVYIHRYNGTIVLGFASLDDFVATSIAASSANIVAEVCNTFEGKHRLPRGIESCHLKLSLAPGLDDARLAFFFAELALLRRADGDLQEREFATMNARIHALIGPEDTAP